MANQESITGPLPEVAKSTRCGAVTVVARLSENRFVARCSCGFMHLVWDNASISLRFRDLKRLLHNPLQPNQVSARQFEMRQDPFGGIQVWAGTGGIRINSGERLSFKHMLQQAIDASAVLAANEAHQQVAQTAHLLN